MAYAESADVAAYCRNLLDGRENFGPETHPRIDQVTDWLSSGCSHIESRLMSLGYDVPAASTSIVWGKLKDLNTYFGASRAELARVGATVEPNERTRWEFFDKLFWDGIDDLGKTDLTSVGLTRSNRGVIFSGGISKTSKQAYESDSDRVKPRISRDMFRYPGTIEPGNTTAS